MMTRMSEIAARRLDFGFAVFLVQHPLEDVALLGREPGRGLRPVRQHP